MTPRSTTTPITARLALEMDLAFALAAASATDTNIDLELNFNGNTQSEDSLPWEELEDEGHPQLPMEVQESFWLDETREGTSARTIALREGLSPRRVQLGVNRAKLREFAEARRLATEVSRAQRWTHDRAFARQVDLDHENEGTKAEEARSIPRLVPLFPIGSFTPDSICSHHGPIRAGSRFCCMVCHASGLDGHPGLKRDPLTDPAPEPKTRATIETANESRSQGDSPLASSIAEPTTRTAKGETRKQRRKRQFPKSSANMSDSAN